MTASLKAGGIAVVAVALGILMTGCGARTVAGAPTAVPGAMEAGAPTSSHRYTIVDYVRDNDIAELPVHQGDPDTPTVRLPIPDGWVDTSSSAPAWAWGQIVSTAPEFADDPPSVTVLMSKLTGDVDPAKILEYAPNEVRNLPGYESQDDGTAGELSGFDAYQIGGTYVQDGAARLVAQKTVVIPVTDGLFVLQLNADGTEDQMGPLMEITSAIDEQTRIVTP